MEPEASGIEAALDAWLAPFLDVMGRVTRRRWAPLCLHGLLGPDGRRSLQPLAGRLGLGGHDQLQHFIASPVWDDAPLRRVLAGKADALVGGPDAVLVVDDTALPKKGGLSVGVARQYCGVLGKRADCQALVSLTLARDEVPLPIGLRLFLPDEWTADPDRCGRAGVPEEHRRALAKPDLALAEIDRAIAAGVRFGRVLADAGYGASAAFRQGLSVRHLSFDGRVQREVLGITVASHRDLERLLVGFNAAYNARRQRVLGGRSPEEVVREGLARDRNLANPDYRPPPDPCVLPKALLVVERAKDVPQPGS